MDRVQPAVVLSGLTKRFGSVTALDGVDLEVPRGSVVGLLGAAGSGKSTAIRVIAGLARPTSGTATVDGSLGVLCQPPGLYDWMTGRELLRFVADLAGEAPSNVDEVVATVLAVVGLEGAGERRISSFNAEERQRLGLGQAIVARPRVVLLDDPAASLDEAGRRAVLGVVADLRGIATVIVATRSIAEVEATCNRVALLVDGRLAMEGPVEEALGRLAPSIFVLDIEPGEGLALAGLVARLNAEPWVRSASANGAGLRVSVLDEERASRELLPAAIATGLGIGSVRRERPSLDEVLERLPAAAGREDES